MLKADGRKYPERTSLTGGFAGGELGLKAYVKSGDVPIAGAAPASTRVRRAALRRLPACRAELS